MKRIVFLSSGDGGNLKFIHKYSKGKSDIEIVGVLTDRNCGARKYALDNDIFTEILTFTRTKAENEKLINSLNSLDASIIITNIHKIISSNVVAKFKGRMINLHYSYLPAFKGVIGMKPVNQALALNNTFIGTTCHFVDADVDSGKIICQGMYNRYQVKNIYQATFECGALTLLNGVYSFINSEVDHEIIYKSYYIGPLFYENIDKDPFSRFFDLLKN